MNDTRRTLLKAAVATTAVSAWSLTNAQGDPAINTLMVTDPCTNTVETTVNLTSFDEDARPPFRHVTAGVAAPHAAMVPQAAKTG
jgi:hypothetical protein